MPKKTNHLAGETSPYLKQHLYNPVDWYPWNAAALRRAVEENKPIFLSIGYSTCHWCHVMASQSFENEKVAAALNDTFVCIKVDREERPDLDAVYMRFCQALNGGGGWPLNVVLTPELKPITAATYIPPDQLIEFAGRMKVLWRDEPEKLRANAENLTAYLKTTPDRRDSAFVDGIEKKAWENLRRDFDGNNGGFGSTPKFPSAQRLMFLLRYWYLTRDPEVMRVVETTLNKMRCGGIYDQIAGGFHRYTIDAAWRVPHFEKMLYDQAMLALLYAEAASATGNPLYRDTSIETIRYVLTRLRSPDGSFISAEDADERYYLWQLEELRQNLSPGEFELATRIYNLHPDGNFVPETGKNVYKLNIPYLYMNPYALAVKMNADVSEFMNIKKRIDLQMLSIRSRRLRPHLDDKIITGWNGLMIAALARAARVFDEPSFLESATIAADNILSLHRRADGGLIRCRVGESPSGQAVLEDYAYVIWGLIDLYEADFNPKYLSAAIGLTEYVNTHFIDPELGGYLVISTDDDTALFRPRSIYDDALPAGGTVMVLNQMRLASLTGSEEYAKQAEHNAMALALEANRSPHNCSMLLNALMFASFPAWEINVVGTMDDVNTTNMLKMLSGAFCPFKSLRFYDAASGKKPMNESLSMVNDTCTVYICRNQTCREPVNSLTEVARILNLKPLQNKTIEVK